MGCKVGCGLPDRQSASQDQYDPSSLYDDQADSITFQGLNEGDRPTKIFIQKVINVGVETIQQDSVQLGLADLIDFSNE